MFTKLAKIVLLTYAFLVSFEHILEVWFGLKTIFKPYRLVAIVFIVLASQITVKKPVFRNVEDTFLYGSFLIGLIVTVYVAFFSLYDPGFFWNDFTQTILYILVLFYAKRFVWDITDFRRLSFAFCLGILLNNVYAIILFLEADISNLIYNRVFGFMDNPNYFALSNCILLIFTLQAFRKGEWGRNISLGIIAFASIGFIAISGSRTSLLILPAVLFVQFMFFLSPVKKIQYTALSLFFGIALFLFTPLGSALMNTPLFWRLTATDATGGMETDIRVLLWEGGLNAGIDTYFIGIGRAQFVNYEVFMKYMINVDAELAARGGGLNLHNDFLTVLIENGFLAFIFYLLFWIFLIVKMSSRLINTINIDQIKTIRTQILLYVSLILFSLFSVTSLSPLYWMTLFLVTVRFITPNSVESIKV